MDATVLAGVAGVLLSLIFGYVPGLKQWFDGLDSMYRRLIMLGALVVVTAGAFGLACVGWFNMPLTCDQAGLEGLVTAFIAALVANQATYSISTASSASRKK